MLWKKKVSDIEPMEKIHMHTGLCLFMFFKIQNAIIKYTHLQSRPVICVFALRSTLHLSSALICVAGTDVSYAPSRVFWFPDNFSQ